MRLLNVLCDDYEIALTFMRLWIYGIIPVLIILFNKGIINKFIKTIWAKG